MLGTCMWLACSMLTSTNLCLNEHVQRYSYSSIHYWLPGEVCPPMIHSNMGSQHPVLSHPDAAHAPRAAVKLS